MKNQTYQTEKESNFWTLSAEDAIARTNSSFKGITENSAHEKLSKRSNTLYMGSHVISGKAKALVMKTAKQTAFDKIQID